MNDIITVKLSIMKANSNIKLFKLNHVKRWTRVWLSLLKKYLIKRNSENKKDIPTEIFAMIDDLKSIITDFRLREYLDK